MSTPPTATALTPITEPSASNCSPIWNASSRVGATTSAQRLRPSSECRIGSPKAAVLPDPVSASPMMSRPPSAHGIASRWIADGFLKPMGAGFAERLGEAERRERGRLVRRVGGGGRGAAGRGVRGRGAGLREHAVAPQGFACGALRLRGRLRGRKTEIAQAAAATRTTRSPPHPLCARKMPGGGPDLDDLPAPEPLQSWPLAGGAKFVVARGSVVATAARRS